jgi:hypothetical protein
VPLSTPTSFKSNDSSCASSSPAAAKRSISTWAALRAPSARRGPIRLSAAARMLLGALPASRAAWAAASEGSPCRLTSAPIATLTSAHSLSSPGSCRSARQTLASMGYCVASSIETPWRLVTCVVASICEAPDASFIGRREKAAPLRAGWASGPCVAQPGLCRPTRSRLKLLRPPASPRTPRG